MFEYSVNAETYYFENGDLKVKFISNYGDTKGKEVIATYKYNSNYADGPAFQLNEDNPHYLEYFYSVDRKSPIVLQKSLTTQTGISSDKIPSEYGGTYEVSDVEKKKSQEENQKTYDLKYEQKADGSIIVHYKDGSGNDTFAVYKKCISSTDGSVKYSLNTYIDADNNCTVTDKSTYVTGGDAARFAGALTLFDCNSTPSGIKVDCFAIEDKPSESGKNKTTEPDKTDTGKGDFTQLCNPDQNKGIVVGFRLVGIFVTIIKIVVPIILIVLGMIDLSKAVTSGNNDALKKSLVNFLKRSIACILVFFVPSFINIIFHMVDGWDNVESDFSTCMNCLTGSDGCPDVKFEINNGD